MDKTCRICGYVFESDKHRVYCSEECRKTGRNGNFLTFYNKHKRANKKECIICDIEFQPYGSQKTCSQECSKKMEMIRKNKYIEDRKDDYEYKQSQKKYRNTPEGIKKRRESGWRYQGIKDMTVQKYNQMFYLQDGRCATCGIHQSEVDTTFHVDHNHNTGEVRGILCQKCNQGLGLFDDDIETLKKVIDYLRK